VVDLEGLKLRARHAVLSNRSLWGQQRRLLVLRELFLGSASQGACGYTARASRLTRRPRRPAPLRAGQALPARSLGPTAAEKAAPEGRLIPSSDAH
jgi:hypothetical protein